ncbi:phage distal tail protein [Actinomadura rubrisoli]|uniref:phage distal tail protein n=1 Tax=Actinomadura rubrisoli TaxID=2530368 RepID=UPI0014047E84|nr:phage tail domain-containing protein [Actinomadura rubrisoli]
MKTAVRLVDGARQLNLHPSLDYIPQKLSVTSPPVREATEPRTDDDGERDSTTLFGGRAVSLEVVVVDEQVDCEVLLDQLKQFLHPRSRPYLYVTDDGWSQERRIRLRVDQWDEPYEGYKASQSRPVQLQWKAPDGIWEAVATVEETVNADLAGDPVGFTFPVTFPVTATATMSAGASTVVNLGGVPSHFSALLYGPCTGPRLINETTGEQIAFTESLVLGPGEYVEIATRERTAWLNSETSQSRLNFIDFDSTSWWRIEPGDQQIRYAPLDTAGAAAAVITYRPAWL